jgi:asparaginyl-tRNA synthetase
MVEPLIPRVTIAALLKDGAPGTQVQVQGWVRTRRDSKGFSFLELNDGSCLANLQVVLGDDLAQHALSTGASVAVAGALVASPGKEQRVELRAERVTPIGGADADFPLQKKRHSFEYLRQIGHLRVRSNTFGAVARVRNALFFAVHEFFQRQGFLFLPAPISPRRTPRGRAKCSA